MIYLSNINLSNNQLQNAVIHPLGTPPANPVEGQLYYNSTAGVKMLYVYNGTAWVPVGDITAITSTESRLVVTNGTSGDVSLSLDIATVVANGGTGLVTADLLYDYIVSLDAVTSVTAGTGISVTGTSSDPIINNTDPGSAQNIFKNVAVSGQSTVVADSNNDTLTLAAGSNVTITTNATTDTITISSTDTNTTYSLSTGTLSGGASISLDGSDLSEDSIKIVGTANEIEVSNVLGDIIIGLPNDVVIAGNLTVIGTTTTNNVETVSTSNGVIFEGNVADANELTLLAGTLTADRTVTLPDATGTIALTSNIGNGTMTVSAGTAMSGGGSFTANQSGNTTVTINHASVARTNNTSTASPAPGGTFTAIDSITTSAEGHVTAVNTKTVTMPATSSFSYATTISASGTITHNLNTKDVVVQLYDTVTNETVYADVVRVNSAPYNTATVTFGNPPTNPIRVLVTKVG
jgi:hypothetical protein